MGKISKTIQGKLTLNLNHWHLEGAWTVRRHGELRTEVVAPGMSSFHTDVDFGHIDKNEKGKKKKLSNI